MEADDDLLHLPRAGHRRGDFSRVGQDVVARGRLSTTVRGACGRCLTPVERTLTADVEELWVRQIVEPRHRRDEDEDEEEVNPDLTHRLTGDRIELAEVFRDVLLAELPDRLLCGEDCKGLCPQCGANLNAEACNCRNGAEADKTLPDWKRQLKDLGHGN
jgi:uncharacterized protein